MKTFLISMVALITLSSCTTHLGQFTVASSVNVRNLDYSTNSSTAAEARGKSCVYYALFFIIGQTNGRLQAAMDDAINNARKDGLDGDLLVDVRIREKAYPFVSCMIVTGKLVSLPE
jgi:hypothetical protein